MKKLLLILLCLPILTLAQKTYVPDDNFEQALINLGYDNVLDDSVITASINTVTTLSIGLQNISDLTGIEDFTALDWLDCGYNNLTSLDVSNNTALIALYCPSNNLTSLDVSQNTALELLGCWENQLTSLDVSQNTFLSELDCSNNQLTSLDVSQNIALTFLFCHYNQLTSLDVSANTALSRLQCQNNQLTSLDLRNGNNMNIYLGSSYYLNLTNNPQLYCIDVDDATYSTANWTVANGHIS